MLCEKCGKNKATTHIKSVVNGVTREYNLCSHCAAESGYGSFGQGGFASMLASMLGESHIGSIGKEKTCPVCGSSFSDIAHSGKMGCAECYKTFGNELMPYLKRVHGSTKHVGKVPNNAPLAVVPKESTVDALKLQLSRAVAEERYEDAAKLRDKIREMEGEGI